MNVALSLVADIGGTHARIALLGADGSLGPVRTVAVADHPGPVEAIAACFGELGVPHLNAAAIAVAAPVAGDVFRLTNAGWTFDRAEIASRLGVERLLLLNDFEALALSLPQLDDSELRRVGGTRPQAQAPKAVLGPGTGLGVSGLIPAGDGWVALSGEGGHVTLAAADAREAAILALARAEHPHVSAERLVSGSGLPLLHRLVCGVDGLACVEADTAAIVDLALAGADRGAVAALETFCALLGGIAGNLALTLGARGGVYLGGGILPRLCGGRDFLAGSAFRQRFEAKGRFAAYLADIPAYVILSAAPALLGAAVALRNPDTCSR